MGDKPWYEKLRGIVDINVDLRNFRFFHITINQNAPLTVDQRRQTAEINLKDLSPEKKREVLNAAKDALLREDFLLLESSAEATVEDFKRTEASPEFKQIIDPLAKYISPGDLAMVKAALYVRAKYKAKSPDAQALKDQLVERYGDRGRKISNLCSAGYFETMILPLLSEMKSVANIEDEFRKSYETIITESGFAVFVYVGMNEEQVKEAVKGRIKANYRYGKRYVHIHGIGTTNIAKIRKCIEELVQECLGLELAIDNKVGSTLYARLEFTDELGKILAGNSEAD